MNHYASAFCEESRTAEQYRDFRACNDVIIREAAFAALQVLMRDLFPGRKNRVLQFPRRQGGHGGEIIRLTRACLTRNEARPLIFSRIRGLSEAAKRRWLPPKATNGIKTAVVWKGRLSNENEMLRAMILVNKQRPRGNLRRDVIAATSRLHEWNYYLANAFRVFTLRLPLNLSLLPALRRLPRARALCFRLEAFPPIHVAGGQRGTRECRIFRLATGRIVQAENNYHRWTFSI